MGGKGKSGRWGGDEEVCCLSLSLLLLLSVSCLEMGSGAVMVFKMRGLCGDICLAAVTHVCCFMKNSTEASSWSCTV